MLTVADVATFLASAFAFAAAGALLLRGRRPRPTQQRFFIAALVALAVETALGAPVCMRLAYSVEPVPHLVRVVVTELAMLGSFCLLGVALFSAIPASKAKRNVLAHAVVLAVCAVAAPLSLYASATPPSPLRTLPNPNFGATAFVVIRILYTTVTTIAFAVRAYRATRLPETSSPMRTGFHLAIAASVIACVHGSWTLAISLGLLTAPVSQDVAALYLAVALALLAAGASVTVWGPVVLAARVRLTTRALRRLWNELADLHHALGVTLRPTARSPTEERLTHYVVALNDLLRASQPYVHPEIRAWSTEVTAELKLAPADESTVATATEFATALDAVRTGRKPATAAGEPLFDRRTQARRRTDRLPSRYAQPDVLAEARLLVAVGYAVRHSPVVDDLRQRAAQQRLSV